MNAPLFAMPPPYVLLVWPPVLVLVLLSLGLFVNATTKKNRGTKTEQNRRAGLGLATMICGPLVGALLAGLGDALGKVHPADVVYTYTVYIVMGSIAGFIAGVAFAVTCVFSTRDSHGKAAFTKSPELWEEL